MEALRPINLCALNGIIILRRKTVSNLENILKSRDITLPTKVYIVKAVVFSVVMYVRVGP